MAATAWADTVIAWIADDLGGPLTPAAFLLGVLLLLAMAGVVIGVVVHG